MWGEGRGRVAAAAVGVEEEARRVATPLREGAQDRQGAEQAVGTVPVLAVGEAVQRDLAHHVAAVAGEDVQDVVQVPASVVVDAVAPAICSGGLLTIATPHDEDRVPRSGSVDPGEALRTCLDALGFVVVAEDREVPWVVRQYNRACRVLFVDCIAARVTW